MTTSLSDLTQRFEAAEIDPAAFGHEEHLRVAVDMLNAYTFADCAARYANSIRTVSIAVGTPDKFNMTITLAFLSLIAERLAAAPTTDCDAFIARNPDLLSKSVLDEWYDEDRLQSAIARRVFLLPQKARSAA